MPEVFVDILLEMKNSLLSESSIVCDSKWEQLEKLIQEMKIMKSNPFLNYVGDGAGEDEAGNR